MAGYELEEADPGSYYVFTIADVYKAGPFSSWDAAEKWAEQQEDYEDLYVDYV